MQKAWIAWRATAKQTGIHLQFLQLLQIGEQSGWYHVDTILVQFQFVQLHQRLEWPSIQPIYLIIIQISARNQNQKMQIAN